MRNMHDDSDGTTHLSEGPFADSAMKVKMVEVDFTLKVHWLGEAATHIMPREGNEGESSRTARQDSQY